MNIINNIKGMVKKQLLSLSCAISTAIAFAPPALAAGNEIMESTLFKGGMKLMQDLGVALITISIVGGGILISIFSIQHAAAQEAHDKEKHAKNRKVVLLSGVWIFASGGIFSIIGAYFASGV